MPPAAPEGPLAGLVVGDLMRPDPLTARADQTLADFAAGVPPDDPREAYPVVDGRRPVGLLAWPCAAGDALLVHDLMAPLERVVVLEEDRSADEAVRAMDRAGAAGALAVDRAGSLVGILSAREIGDALRIEPAAPPRRGLGSRLRRWRPRGPARP